MFKPAALLALLVFAGCESGTEPIEPRSVANLLLNGAVIFSDAEIPAVGAEIRIDGQPGQRRAGGLFAFWNLAPGPYRLIVTSPKYVKYETSLDLAKDETLRIRVERIAPWVESVSVGSSSTEFIINAPNGVSELGNTAYFEILTASGTYNTSWSGFHSSTRTNLSSKRRSYRFDRALSAGLLDRAVFRVDIGNSLWLVYNCTAKLSCAEPLTSTFPMP